MMRDSLGILINIYQVCPANLRLPAVLNLTTCVSESEEQVMLCNSVVDSDNRRIRTEFNLLVADVPVRASLPVRMECNWNP